MLELGANVGRNTAVIATILNDDRRLVTLESWQPTAQILEENKSVNGFRFHIEASALSETPLAQLGWACVSYNTFLRQTIVQSRLFPSTNSWINTS